MKKILLLTSLLVFCGMVNAFAYPVTAGDEIYFQDSYGHGSTGGGEFLIKDWDTKELLFTTFCLEYGEHISYNTKYTVTGISDRAFGGGHDAEDNGAGDPLSEATKWLYWSFVNGDLDDTGLFNYNENGSYNALQYAIWFLEDEVGNAGTGGASLVDYALQITTADDYYFDGNVAVMNLGRYQDQLIAGPAPVPEPATLVLLGSGLVGLAVYRRKRK